MRCQIISDMPMLIPQYILVTANHFKPFHCLLKAKGSTYNLLDLSFTYTIAILVQCTNVLVGHKIVLLISL